MMFFPFSPKTLLACLCLIALFQACKPARLLRQQEVYPPGYSLKYRYSTRSETKTDFMGAENRQSNSEALDYELKVTTSRPDGSADWRIMITRAVYMTESERGVSFVYDSDNPDRDTSELRNRIFDAMLGGEMQMTTSPQGHVTAFSGATALFDKMMAVASVYPSVELLATSLRATMNDSAMLKSFSNSLGFYPKKPIKVGKSWTVRQTDTGTAIPMESVYTYTLLSRDLQQAMVKTTSRVKTKPGASLDMGLAKFTYNLEGKGSGQSWMTQPDGILKKGTHTLIFSGTMKMSGNGLPKVSVPISTTTTVTIELLQPD